MIANKCKLLSEQLRKKVIKVMLDSNKLACEVARTYLFAPMGDR